MDYLKKKKKQRIVLSAAFIIMFWFFSFHIYHKRSIFSLILLQEKT